MAVLSRAVMQAVLAAGALFVFMTEALAACTGPPGVAGEIVYNEATHAHYFCNNTDWIAMAPPGAGGTGCAGPANPPPGVEGEFLFNEDAKALQYCDGLKWVAFGAIPGPGGAGCSGPAGAPGEMTYNSDNNMLEYCDGTRWLGFGSGIYTTPNAFVFTDLTDQPPSTPVVSDIVLITGLIGGVETGIAGGGGQYRICDDAACAADPVFFSGASTIVSGQYLQLRLTSSAVDMSAVDTTMTVGTLSDNWSVTTLDNTPDAFAFTDVIDQPKSTAINSDIVQITGITGSPVTSIAGGGGKYRVCADATCSAAPAFITTASSITDGQYLQLQITSSASDLTAVATTMTVGSVSDNWSVTTNDNAPVAFAFTDQADVALSTVADSNIIQITGITGTVATSIAGGSGAYRICADATCSADPAFISTASSITNDQYLQLRLTSAATDLTPVSATMTVGSGSDNWSVTTNDNAPTAFTFTDKTGVALSALTPSNPAAVQITGITGTVATSISGSGAEYRICTGDATGCGGWTTGASAIQNTNYVELRLTSSASYTTAVNTTMTVGTGSDGWSVTTLDDTTPNAFAFTDKAGVALSTLTYSNPAAVQITGITGDVATSISGSGAEYRICTGDGTGCGGWTAGASTIQNTNYVELRLTGSGSYNTAVATTITVGSGSDNWSVTTTPTANGFSFTDQTGVALSTLTASNAVALGGGFTNLTATCGGSCSGISRNGGGFLAGPVAGFNSGDQIAIRLTSSGSYSTAVTATVTVGGTTSGTWSVTTRAPNNCTGTPWGTVAHGYSNTAYQSASVACPGPCVSETRTCTDGSMSGSYTNTSCSVGACTCNLPWGGTLPNGNSVTAYSSSASTAGFCKDNCASFAQTRTCTNGVLSGSYANQTCSANSCTGGSVADSGGYRIHTFNSSGTFTVNGVAGNVEALVVAGGGGGSTAGGNNPSNGGGGGGGVRYSASVGVSVGAIGVTVGAGGGCAAAGGGSALGGYLSTTGGGAGASRCCWTTNGGNGGSGGGANEGGVGGLGIAGEGNNGSGGVGGGYNGGGGGGAGGATSDWNGGAGAFYSISGSSVAYGAGGGGGERNGNCGVGGSSCGGNGGGCPTFAGAGLANRGCGGGGGAGGGGGSPSPYNACGAGGSGVVIVRYPF